ncbi:MAG: GIY-YIG nuclease family protein [Bacteroidota bacterium]|nr:GIY-YIG nuclease family protein [Bacteroidota bacterium]
MRRKFHVYILLCADGTYYTGMTNNICRRLAEHETGYNPKSYTALRLPVQLMWTERYNSPRYAYKMEWKFKKWSAAKKKALIEGRIDDLKNLARCLNKTSHEYWKVRLASRVFSSSLEQTGMAEPSLEQTGMNSTEEPFSQKRNWSRTE